MKGESAHDRRGHQLALTTNCNAPLRYRKVGVFVGSAIAILLAVPAVAASQGTLGATSTGTVTITASIPQRAGITSLEDVSFINQDPDEAAFGVQKICVWSNTLSRTYSITASGSGIGRAFALANERREVPYSVHWTSVSDRGGGASLSSGVASPTVVTAATQQECKSGPSASASLVVRIEPDDLQAMEPGATYVGFLTLMVSPL